MNTSKNTHEYEKLLSVVRELYGRVAWTHKTHEKDREIWSNKVCRVRWVNVVLIGITTLLATAGAITNSPNYIYCCQCIRCNKHSVCCVSIELQS